MTQFNDKAEMLAAWVNDRAAEMCVASGGKYEDAIQLATIMARSAWVYVPHLYRGGYVIRGFGYSVERIGKYISAQEAGNPLAV